MLPTTAAGAAAIDAVLQPCRGLQAVFGLKRGACENGHYVGYDPRHAYYYNKHDRRVYER